MTGWSAALGGIVLVVAVVALPALAIADNCGSIGDCWGTAAAAAAAAAGAGALAATAAGSGKDDDCEAERAWAFRCKSWVDTCKAQLKYYGDQLEALKQPADELIARANELAPEAQREVAEAAVEALFEKLGELVTMLVAPEIAEAREVIDLATDPAGAIPGMEYVRFFQEISSYFQLMSGDLDGVAQFADEHNLVTAQRFVETMRELQRLAARGSQLGNKMDEVRVDLKKWQEELDKAEAALQACEAGHAAAA